jgi:hypothetical protein
MAKLNILLMIVNTLVNLPLPLREREIRKGFLVQWLICHVFACAGAV